MDSIDFWPSAKNKRAAIELLKIHAIDTPCERDIFRTVSPIDFRFEISSHITYRINAIDFWTSAKNKMAGIVTYDD